MKRLGALFPHAKTWKYFLSFSGDSGFQSVVTPWFENCIIYSFLNKCSHNCVTTRIIKFFPTLPVESTGFTRLWTVLN